jgi:uncharacterized membrane protein YkvA (DUF1232 family)
MPIDLVPDFLPMIGYADDAIIVAIGLRSVVRAAGPEDPSRSSRLRVMAESQQPELVDDARSKQCLGDRDARMHADVGSGLVPRIAS